MPGCDIRSSDKTSLHCTEPCKETSITEAIITIVNVNVISPCRPRVVPNCHGLGIASLCMGTCGRRFRRARFPSNGRFFRRNRRMFGIGLRCNPTSEPSTTTTTTETRKQKKATGKISKTKTLNVQHTVFGRFLCLLCTTDVVKREWIGNSIVAPSISSEIPIQRQEQVIRCATCRQRRAPRRIWLVPAIPHSVRK